MLPPDGIASDLRHTIREEPATSEYLAPQHAHGGDSLAGNEQADLHTSSNLPLIMSAREPIMFVLGLAMVTAWLVDKANQELCSRPAAKSREYRALANN